MTRVILWRLVQLPVILGLVFLGTFVLVWVVPGNPLERPEAQRPPVEVQEAMKRQYNLHSPWAFLAAYLKSAILKGDLGPSLQYRDQRVNDLLAQGLPVSATIGLAGLALALIIGLGAGLIGAVRPGSILEGLSLGVALVGVSLPAFVVASVLLAVAAGCFHWAPVGVWEWPGWAIWEAGWGHRAWQLVRALILPALAVSAMPAAYIARLIRMGLAEVMASDFIRTARAKGLPERVVLLKHALKVAFLPVLSFLGPAAAGTMTGSFVVEQVFAIPGLGQHFVNAVLNRDQFLILGVVLVYSSLLVLFNLLVDILYAWIDPRIQLEG